MSRVLPTLSVAADQPSLPGGVSTATFTLTRTGDRSGPTVAHWTLSTGAAGTSWFGEGEGAKTVYVDEPPPGLLTLTLGSVDGATVTTGSASCRVGREVESPKRELVRAHDFKVQPPSLYHRTLNPAGEWKTTGAYDKDGEDHPDQGKWSNWGDAAGSRSGEFDLQTYVDQAYCGLDPFSRTADGLVITARTNPAPNERVPRPYTGGLLTTEMGDHFRYGVTEFTGVRMDPVSGLWGGLWQLGQPHGDYAWDELDIELLGGDPGWVYFNAHLPRLGYSLPGARVACDWTKPTDFAIQRTPEKVGWFINGVKAHEVDNPSDGFQRPMYVLMDLAVGPSSGGWADINLPAPKLAGSMTVGGVRIYR